MAILELTVVGHCYELGLLRTLEASSHLKPSILLGLKQSFQTLEFFFLVRQGGRERYEADGKVSINYCKNWGALGANKLIILMICFENNFTGSLVE